MTISAPTAIIANATAMSILALALCFVNRRISAGDLSNVTAMIAVRSAGLMCTTNVALVMRPIDLHGWHG